jgi:hypothetical protein
LENAGRNGNACLMFTTTCRMNEGGTGRVNRECGKGSCSHGASARVVYLPLRRTGFAFPRAGSIAGRPSLIIRYRWECRCSGCVGATICLRTWGSRLTSPPIRYRAPRVTLTTGYRRFLAPCSPGRYSDVASRAESASLTSTNPRTSHRSTVVSAYAGWMRRE